MIKPGPGEISKQVREQYEAFPYPDIDLESDKPQLLVSGHLDLMNEILWAGKKKPGGLRVLDAGCGTGGPVVAMALAYPQTEILGIDFSEASLLKAKRLAEKYGVQNVRFIHLPIERLPELGMTFDYVSASGVLHHLPDPVAGLRAIARVLDPQGAVSLMLYGQYGRTGVYMMQEAFKVMGQPQAPEMVSPFLSSLSMSERARFAHRLALSVPPWHPLGPRLKGREMQEGKEAGIVDLLLHANDIPFDVASVYTLCQEAGMRFYRWLIPLIYNLDNYFKDPVLSPHITPGKMPRRQHEELAELAHGRNSKHSFFAVLPGFKEPQVEYEKGKWRKLRAKLTECLAWKRTMPVPGKKDTYSVPFSIVQDAWGPLEISQWELAFLSLIVPEITLGQIIENPGIRRLHRFRSDQEMNEAVETLLKKSLDRLAIVWLEA